MSRGSRWRRSVGGVQKTGRVAVVLLAMAGLVGTGLISLGAPAGAAEQAKHVPVFLRPGKTLASRTYLSAADGRFHLNMQRDGNLVLYQHFGADKALWQSGTGGHPGARAVMQRDGNFVVYDGKHALWATGTDKPGDAGSYLFVQVNARFDIYSKSGKMLWTSYEPLRVKPLPYLGYGYTGPDVVTLQQELTALGYWVGPANGVFGDSTEQALWALEKAAGIPRTGVLDAATEKALELGTRPHFRPAKGTLIEVDLKSDLVMFIRNGRLYQTLNTSTGGGYYYTEGGVTSRALTPQGIFHTYYEIDGTDIAPLGTLWRPKFFTGGYAIHGDSYVPPIPVSHGCVRVSDEAINHVWAANLDPIGTEVWVY
jgi:peptidoglycan hydrolase-like protein with peptidoglycan-binding domain